jgi:hypothetical protein
MGFASAYIEKRILFPQLVKEASDDRTGIIVVIPSYNETGVVNVLESLALCAEPECRTEVIIVVNSPAGSSEETREINRTTLKNIESWKSLNKNCFFRLFALNIGDPDINGWGVGLARKTGMDEAVRRFDSIGNPDGLIVNLDADCYVESNYFVSIYEAFLRKKHRNACSIYFEHPLSGNDFNSDIYLSIALYELHLRYYLQGLAFSGFPYVFHTVGSAIAVRASAYVRAGGMNRRQAGEDFYFIQKLMPLGGYFNLNTTVVYPSPRLSFRVPFGTGAMMTKMAESSSPQLETYSLAAFRDLRSLFTSAGKIYGSPLLDLNLFYTSLPESIRLFVSATEWIEKLTEIKNNTAGEESFRKRFFEWFNMFSIVKYMNHVHSDYYQKVPVEECASALLEETGISMGSADPSALLLIYRSLEKNA